MLLQLVYQKSLDTSCLPEDWHKTNVTPIYKQGPKYLAENYLDLLQDNGTRVGEKYYATAFRPFRSFSMPFDVNLKSDIMG
jgi:hypothetical protein